MTEVDNQLRRPEAVPEALAPIIAAIREAYEPESVILYGSAGQGRPWRDLDLLVITDTPNPPWEQRKKISAARGQATGHIPIDLFVLTPEEVRTRVKENRFFLIEEILKKGRVVYGSVPPLHLSEKAGPTAEMREADVGEWLARAEIDLRAATILMEAALFPQTVFHCQQAVEKVLKAFLLAKTGAYPRAHGLAELVELAGEADASMRELGSSMKPLDESYLTARYPDAEGPEIDGRAAAAALELAQATVRSVRGKI